MKKYIAMLLIFTLLLGLLCACGGKDKPAEEPKEETEAAESPKLEKGLYGIVDSDGSYYAFMEYKGKKISMWNSVCDPTMEDEKITYKEEDDMYYVGGEPAFSLKESKKGLQISVPSGNGLGFNKGKYTLEALEELPVTFVPEPEPEPEPKPDDQSAGNETDPSGSGTVTENPPEPPTPPAPPEPVKPTPYTSGMTVVSGDDLYFLQDDGIYYTDEGTVVKLCSGTFGEYAEFCMNETEIIAAEKDGTVIRVSLSDRTVEKLFKVQDVYTASIIGAGENEIVVATQRAEEDWFGSRICGYKPDGSFLREYGEHLEGKMIDGILLINRFRSDVSTVSLYAYDFVNDKLVADVSGDREVWSYEMYHGALYYTSAPAEVWSIKGEYPLRIECVDDTGVSMVRTFIINADKEDFVYAGITLNVVNMIDSTGTSYFDLESGEPISAPVWILDGCYEMGYDATGNYYEMGMDGNLWRMNEEGTYKVAAVRPEGNMGLAAVTSGYVYFMNYDTREITVISAMDK